MFLQACKPGDGDMGQLIRRLRERRDMPRHFPHKTAMVKYLYYCKVESGVIVACAPQLYQFYRQFYEQTMHPQDDSAVVFIRPEQLVKSGVRREQLALTILEGLGLFSDPAENFEAGGKWTDSALSAADAVIALLNKEAGS